MIVSNVEKSNYVGIEQYFIKDLLQKMHRIR